MFIASALQYVRFECARNKVSFPPIILKQCSSDNGRWNATFYMSVPNKNCLCRQGSTSCEQLNSKATSIGHKSHLRRSLIHAANISPNHISSTRPRLLRQSSPHSGFGSGSGSDSGSGSGSGKASYSGSGSGKASSEIHGIHAPACAAVANPSGSYALHVPP
jgi:uncharacterized membrane protein YgcG